MCSYVFIINFEIHCFFLTNRNHSKIDIFRIDLTLSLINRSLDLYSFLRSVFYLKNYFSFIFLAQRKVMYVDILFTPRLDFSFTLLNLKSVRILTSKLPLSSAVSFIFNDKFLCTIHFQRVILKHKTYIISREL